MVPVVPLMVPLMEPLMEPSSDPGGDPYGRPARRTQWIVSTLAYHYGLDRGVENEIIVLATGLDQYLQEIFHHLDYRGGGRVPVEDFNILCQVLGLNKDQDQDQDQECARTELTFRHFHAQLCGHFSSRAGCLYETGRPLGAKDSQHIETQIRLRSPLRRRERRGLMRTDEGCRPGPCSRECYEEIVALEEAEDRLSKMEEENQSLRELVEDMRAALQSSDARCLALQVGLWKSHSKYPTDDGCFIARHRQSVHKTAADTSLRTSEENLKSLQKLIQEIEVLHSSRDQQMEEAMLGSRRLEEELLSSREMSAALEDSNRALKKEQVVMRRKVEEARQALLSGLSRVKELEATANHVPALQRHILQLEAELLYHRSAFSKPLHSSSIGAERSLRVSSSSRGRRCCSDTRHDRCSPTGRAEAAPDKMEEQLFRSVEGQAASDEEDDKWTGDQQRQVDEVKNILTRLSCCGDRCDDTAFKKLISSFGSSRSEESCSAVLELLERVTRLHKQLEMKEKQTEIDMDQVKESLMQELQQKSEETELLHMELQMLETERVRLSLVEEKLLDVLQLLQKLRELNVSRRSLGKILLSTLESCSDPQHGKAHILEVLNALYHELAACEVLTCGEPLENKQSQQSLNALVISC